jgi:hypothetical protein
MTFVAKKKKKIDPVIGGDYNPPQRPGERDLATPSGHFYLSGEQPKKKKKEEEDRFGHPNPA